MELATVLCAKESMDLSRVAYPRTTHGPGSGGGTSGGGARGRLGRGWGGSNVCARAGTVAEHWAGRAEQGRGLMGGQGGSGAAAELGSTGRHMGAWGVR